MNNEESVTIGIDLGTYNSAATVNLGDEPVMLKSEEGMTDQGICFPSFVEFNEMGEFLRVGEYARRAIDLNPERVVWGVKRLIGKSYKEVKSSGDLERFQYKVNEGKDGSCRIKVGQQEYSPTEISSFVLKKIKEDAEANFNPINVQITEATVTVPAYFGPFQRAETEQAAKMAGFDKVRLIPEPTAAALSYKLRVEQKDQFIIVIDIGAGTFDVTVALMFLDKNGILQTLEKGHGGNTALGGIDIDDAILQQTIKRFDLRHVFKDSHGRAKLRMEIEKAKIGLSEKNEVKIKFTFSKSDVDIVLQRADIDSAIGQIIERCKGPIDIALKESSLLPKDIAHVLLVGGPTKMSIFRAMVKKIFKDNPEVVREIAAIDTDGFPVDPMEAVAKGAVLGLFGGITPHAYGILSEGAYYEMIPRRTRYPCNNLISWLVSGKKRSLVLSLIQKAIDPMNYQEVYLMLGVFQFDYHPEPDKTGVHIEIEYSENGILNLQIVQPTTSIKLPLYNVSKLEGRKISKPSTPLPINEPTYGNFGGTGSGGNLSGMFPKPQDLEQWSKSELEVAIKIGNKLNHLAQIRIDKTSTEDRENIERVLNELKQCIANTWKDINTRTPQIRNYNKALLNAMVVGRLVSNEELKELQKGFE